LPARCGREIEERPIAPADVENTFRSARESLKICELLGKCMNRLGRAPAGLAAFRQVVVGINFAGELVEREPRSDEFESALAAAAQRKTLKIDGKRRWNSAAERANDIFRRGQIAARYGFGFSEKGSWLCR